MVEYAFCKGKVMGSNPFVSNICGKKKESLKI